MTPKALRWWEGEFDKACALACVLGCSLSFHQFCAARGLEEEEREAFLAHLHKHSTCL